MAAADPVWLGIDAGTQSLKVAVVDDTGGLVGSAAAPLTSVRSGDRHEQDPGAWWSALQQACRQALAGLDVARLRALSVCSTSGTIVLVGDRGEPLTPALMYDDARAAAEAREVAQVADEVGTHLGHPIQTTWALPRLLWLLGTGSGARRASAGVRLAHGADFLSGRLTGRLVATDWTNALKTGYDLVELRWPQELFDRLGVAPEVLPEVVRPGTELGTVSRAAAELTGLPAGLVVRAGMTDGCASQVAAGALAVGSWNSVLGTTLVVKGVTEERLDDPDGAVYSHRHPDRGWLPGGASNVGARAVTVEFPDADLERLDALASEFEPAAGVVYPLTGRGERFPFVAPDAERFESARLDTLEERYAALLQGVAFTERLCYDRLARLGADIRGPVAITGGATRSDYWNRLRSSVLGRQLLVPRHAEAAVGMAVIAAAGDGELAATAARMVSITETIDPDRRTGERLAPAYRSFIDGLVERGYIDALDGAYATQRWAA